MSTCDVLALAVEVPSHIWQWAHCEPYTDSYVCEAWAHLPCLSVA